jgi:hypothetical protein
VICTDDSGVFNITLSTEYQLLASVRACVLQLLVIQQAVAENLPSGCVSLQTFGLSRSQLFALAAGATEFVFGGAEVKTRLRKLFADRREQLLGKDASSGSSTATAADGSAAGAASGAGSSAAAAEAKKA